MKKIIILCTLILCLGLIFQACSPDQGVDPAYLGGLSNTQINPQISVNAGIFPEEGWDSVLDDPYNPFRESIGGDPTTYEGTPIGDSGGEKWNAENSDIPELQFYVWTTTLAENPSGEAQLYAGYAMENLYSNTGISIWQSNAIRAFQSVLIYFQNSQTYNPTWGWLSVPEAAYGKLEDYNADTLGVKMITGSDGNTTLVFPEQLNL